MNTTYSDGSGFGTSSTITLRGNTFAHKDWIKTLAGARYDRNRKVWTISRPTNNRTCSQLAYELRKAGITF